MNKVKFLELECVSLKNESISILATTEVGPRIVALFAGGENIFAELPEQKIDIDGYPPYHLLGGHRLWYAPEVPERTYLPDDKPPMIELDDSRLICTQAPELESGIEKQIAIWLPNDQPIVLVDHTLKNQGSSTITCAPWAITQLKPGGTAILPQYESSADAYGLQPNRSIALWPYTDINSKHVRLGNRYLYLEAALKEGAFKVGFPNPDGWLAYYRNQKLFVKSASYHAGMDYFDYTSSSQCYCNEAFIELETLGAKISLKPGKSVTHREAWQIFTDIDLSLDELELSHRLDEIGVTDSLSLLNT